MASNYWSSSTNANNPNNALIVNFNNGNDDNNNKNNNNYVRAVRGGKSSLLSFRSVFQAYLDCRKRKRGTIHALKFEEDVLRVIEYGSIRISSYLSKGHGTGGIPGWSCTELQPVPQVFHRSGLEKFIQSDHSVDYPRQFNR
ncbi:MAG: hypothetical protein AB1547_09650 [Thermodesulfobacteriota bacterium]